MHFLAYSIIISQEAYSLLGAAEGSQNKKEY
jgi:hypothetical protein